MFGYIITNPETLSKEEKGRYGKYYCGLCHQLDARYGGVGRASLTYDMTFLSMLLSSLYELEETQGSRYCVSRPLKKHPYVVTPVTTYAADMNIILVYYQCLDDWNDDRNLVAKEKGKRLEAYLPHIKEENFRQYTAIEDSLQHLGGWKKPTSSIRIYPPTASVS